MMEREITLKQKVKEDIYLDFRLVLERMDNYSQMPIPPNRLAFLSSFMILYVSIKNKLKTQLKQNKEKYKKFEKIVDYMNKKKSVKKLDLNECFEMVFLIAEFLDLIGITMVWD